MTDGNSAASASGASGSSAFQDCVYDANGNIICIYNGLPFQATPDETPDEWAQLQQLIADGQITVAPYVPPPPPSSAEQWAAYQAFAVAVLQSTDAVIPKVVEAVILGKNNFTGADVVAFMQWREQLRAIIAAPTGDPSVSLPPQPPVPAGA